MLCGGCHSDASRKHHQTTGFYKETTLARIDNRNIIDTSIKFSNNGELVGYIVKESKSQYVVVNNRKGENFDAILSSRPLFSPTGAVAYIAKTSAGVHVVLNDKRIDSFDEWVGDPFFLPSGDLTYYSKRNGKTFITIGIWHSAGYDYIGIPGFSADGKSFAFYAREGVERFMVINGEKHGPYDDVGAPVFSANGQRILYAAMRGRKCFIVADGDELDSHDGTWEHIFSPDGNRIAYIAREKNEDFVVVDGKRHKGYKNIDNLIFSLDGNSFAYCVREDAYMKQNGGVFSFYWRRNFVVHNDSPGKSYDDIDGLIFAPDGRLIYKAKRDNTWFLVVDGKDLDIGFDWFKFPPKFCSDGSKMGYVVASGGSRPSEPDSCDMWIGGSRYLVVGNARSKAYDQIFDFHFTQDGTLVGFGARQGDALLWNVMNVGSSGDTTE